MEEWDAVESDGALWQHGIEWRGNKIESIQSFDARRGREHWLKDEYATRRAIANRNRLLKVKTSDEAHNMRQSVARRMPFAPPH